MWKFCKLGWGDNTNKKEFGGYFKICKIMYTLPLMLESTWIYMIIFLLLDNLKVLFCFQIIYIMWILYLIRCSGVCPYAFKVFNDCNECFYSSDIKRGELQQVIFAFLYFIHQTMLLGMDGNSEWNKILVWSTAFDILY